MTCSGALSPHATWHWHLACVWVELRLTLQGTSDTLYRYQVSIKRNNLLAQTVMTSSRSASQVASIDKPAVCIRDLTIGYDRTPVMSDIDLTLGWGLLVGVIGPNGAGKCTLIKTILDTLRPMKGTAEVAGWPAHTREALNNVGYVPQREAVNWDFPVTVSDVVMMGRTGRLG